MDVVLIYESLLEHSLSDIGLGEIAEFLNELAFDLVIQSLGL